MSIQANEILKPRTIKRPTQKDGDHVRAGKQQNVIPHSTYLTQTAYEMEEPLGDYSTELY